MIKIPFNRPFLVGKEMAYVQEAITAMHLSGDGGFTKRCERLLESSLGAGRVLLSTSGTTALDMAALLLGIQPGDEVILPSFTFPSTANAFVLRGARPVFADIRRDTKNIDERQLDRLLSPRTRAIVVVHYAGVGCEMDVVLEKARQHGLAVIEDNAHGLYGKYKGRFLGTFGSLAALSFHETKNFTCGEGGALVINAPEFVERAEVLREKGTNRARYFRGQVDKYSWIDVGSSYIPSDLLAAFLFAQLEGRDDIQKRRQWIWDAYCEGRASWATLEGVALPSVPAECEQSYHMFHMLMPTPQQRDRLIAHLNVQGINCIFHYLPLHSSEMGRKLGGRPGDCPVAEYVSDRLIRLPFHTCLSINEIKTVVTAIRAS